MPNRAMTIPPETGAPSGDEHISADAGIFHATLRLRAGRREHEHNDIDEQHARKPGGHDQRQCAGRQSTKSTASTSISGRPEGPHYIEGENAAARTYSTTSSA